MYVYQSETTTFAANLKKSIPLGFVPTTNPDGGHNVISHFVIQLKMTATTGAGVSVAAGNQARWCKFVRIWDAEGDLLYLPGYLVRASAIYEDATQAPKDPAAIAASSTAAARTINLVIPFERRRARRRWDTALPVRTLQAGGGIEVTLSDATMDGNFTGGNPSSVSGTFVVYAYCRSEDDLQAHTRLVRSYITQQAAVDNNVELGGALLRSMFLFKPSDTTDGGTDWIASNSGFTGITVDALNWSNLDYQLLPVLEQEESIRDNAGTYDPFRANATTQNALPVVWPKRDQKITDMFRKKGTGPLLVRLVGNSNVTGADIYLETISKRTARSSASEIVLTQGAKKVTSTVKTPKGARPMGTTKRSEFLPSKVKAFK